MNTKAYKVVYMLPLDADEKSSDEFIQKFEDEVIRYGASIVSTNKMRQQMVKTTTNKGSRNVFVVVTDFTAPPASIVEIIKFLKLSRGSVVNHIIFDDENKVVNPSLDR